MLLSRIVGVAFFTACAVFGQYKAESAGAPPSAVPAPFTAKLQAEGTRVTGPDGVVCEIWLAKTLAKGGSPDEQNVTLSPPHGALMGVIRFPVKGKDRRGQQVPAGVYTLRYSMFPISGDHQGVAPQRDFMVLSAIADDADPNATPAFDKLMAISEKGMGLKHPGVLSIWKADDQNQSFTKQGESDWVLQRKIGDTNVAIVVIGTASA